MVQAGLVVNYDRIRVKSMTWKERLAPPTGTVSSEGRGAAQEPDLNHLVEVLDLVVQATIDLDMDTLIAALLHDVIEDTATTLRMSLGSSAEIIRKNSEAMSLPKPERRRARITAMALKSREARIVKMADVISNLHAIAEPAGPGAQTGLRPRQTRRNRDRGICNDSDSHILDTLVMQST
jgi:HD domain